MTNAETLTAIEQARQQLKAYILKLLPISYGINDVDVNISLHNHVANIGFIEGAQEVGWEMKEHDGVEWIETPLLDDNPGSTSLYLHIGGDE